MTAPLNATVSDLADSSIILKDCPAEKINRVMEPIRQTIRRDPDPDLQKKPGSFRIWHYLSSIQLLSLSIRCYHTVRCFFNKLPDWTAWKVYAGVPLAVWLLAGCGQVAPLWGGREQRPRRPDLRGVALHQLLLQKLSLLDGHAQSLQLLRLLTRLRLQRICINGPNNECK